MIYPEASGPSPENADRPSPEATSAQAYAVVEAILLRYARDNVQVEGRMWVPRPDMREYLGGLIDGELESLEERPNGDVRASAEDPLAVGPPPEQLPSDAPVPKAAELEELLLGKQLPGPGAEDLPEGDGPDSKEGWVEASWDYPPPKVELVVEGSELRRLAIGARAIGPNVCATVIRETLRPDLSDRGYDSEIFRLRTHMDTTTISVSKEFNDGSEEQPRSSDLLDFLSDLTLEEALGEDRVHPDTCKELAQQILSMRIDLTTYHGPDYTL